MSHSTTAIAAVNHGDGELATLAHRINQIHQAACEAITKGLLHAREAGEVLVQAKAQCPNGTWGDWLEENFQGSARTAQRYMTIATRWPELEAKTTRLPDLPYREAVQLLADDRPEGERLFKTDDASLKWYEENRFTVDEATQLIKHADVILAHRVTQGRMGRSLAAIRDGKLYRETHKTFKAYYTDKFDMAPEDVKDCFIHAEWLETDKGKAAEKRVNRVMEAA